MRRPAPSSFLFSAPAHSRSPFGLSRRRPVRPRWRPAPWPPRKSDGCAASRSPILSLALQRHSLRSVNGGPRAVHAAETGCAVGRRQGRDTLWRRLPAGRRYRTAEQRRSGAVAARAKTAWSSTCGRRAPDTRRRPVMVWFHGRGFYAGAASERLYDGARLAKRGDLVVVTVNHRLNAVRLSLPRKAGGDRLQGLRQCRRAGHAARARVGPRQHRRLRRRRRQRHDLRRIGRRREGLDAARHARRARLVHARDYRERRAAERAGRAGKSDEGHRDRDAQTQGHHRWSNCRTCRSTRCSPPVTETGRTTPDFGPVIDGAYLPADMFDPIAARQRAPASRSSSAPIATSTRCMRGTIPKFGKPFSDADLRSDLAADFKNPGVEPLIAAYKESRPDATRLGPDGGDPQQSLPHQRDQAGGGAVEGRADVSIQFRLRADGARRSPQRRDRLRVQQRDRQSVSASRRQSGGRRDERRVDCVCADRQSESRRAADLAHATTRRPAP